jgi:hypothetical protein
MGEAGLMKPRPGPAALIAAAAATLLLAAAGPPVPDGRLGQPTAPILLLSRPDVRGDLGLSSEQADGAEEAAADLYRRAEKLKGKRDDQATEARRAINQDQWAWIKSNLKPEQRTRLVQINLQWQGVVTSLNEPVIADTLGLRPDQRTALAAALAKRDEARARGMYSAADERALSEQADTLLTPPQRERWKAMLGPPFTPQLSSASRSSARPR